MFNFINFDLFSFIISTLVFAIIFDMIIGELPSKIHPVVIIGKIIDFFTDLFIKIRNNLYMIINIGFDKQIMQGN